MAVEAVEVEAAEVVVSVVAAVVMLETGAAASEGVDVVVVDAVADLHLPGAMISQAAMATGAAESLHAET